MEADKAADKAATTDEMAAAVGQATAAGREAAATDKGPAEKRTAERREVVRYLLGKPQEERTTEEEAVVQGFMRGHKEGTAAKAKVAAAERATAQRAAAEEAGNNMDRYDEVKRRFEKWWETGDGGGEEERGAICRLHDEATEDGEK